MSFTRLIFYHAMLGGWAAFVGWLLSEALFLRRSGDIGMMAVLATAAIVGACIGGGISLLGPLTQGRGQGFALRLAFCIAGGFVGGMVGALLGNVLFVVLPRAVGWVIMGIGIGGVEGIYDQSFKKIRNGLLGGALGGLLGGLCFEPVVHMVSRVGAGGNMSGRAVAFVLLGLCIGFFIGLAQLIFREAWLTVEEGYRPGRQLILDLPTTSLGTSEKAQLPFIAFGAKGVDPIHAQVVRQPDGTYLLRDNASRGGTTLNGARVSEEILRDGDAIQLGPNVVRFHEVVRHGSREATERSQPPPVETSPPRLPTAAPTPPPVPKTPPRAATVSQASAPTRTVQPSSVQTMPPKPAPMGPKGKPCPKCGKSATPIPGGAQHLCMSCDMKF